MAIAVSSNAQQLSVGTIEAVAGKQTEMTVSLTGATGKTALQYNLSLPAGLTLAQSSGDYGIKLGNATKGHTLSVSPLASGDLLIVLYSMYQDTFADGTLMTIPVVATGENGTTSGSLNTVRTATAGAVSSECSDVSFNAEIKSATIAVTGITLNQTSATLTEGESLTLTATVSPDDATDKTVTWSSSNESVATVKNGVVTAMAAGTATITAKAGDKTATCEVTVKPVPVSGIVLDKTTAELLVGESLTLTATVSPDNATDKTVTWSTSDATIATVDNNGVVKAIKVGKVTITAKAGEKTATCEVTVEKKEEPLPQVASGEYYLYNVETNKFFSRGEYWGTCATVDKYGIPFTWNAEERSLTFLDSEISLFETADNNVYTDNVSTGFTFDEVENGYMLKSLKSDRYLGIVDAVYTNQIVNVTDDAGAATVWQLKSKDEHDAIVAGYVNQNYENVIKAAGLGIGGSDFVAELAKYTAVDKTDAIGTARFTGSLGSWTFNQVREQGGQPAIGNDFCELWQGTGSYTQTVEGLAEGIYKVTVQGFERSGGWARCNALAAKGYEITTATLSANGEEVNLKSWYSGKSDDSNPNNTSEAVAKFNEGKYLNEVYAYVGKDGKLAIAVNKPSHVGDNWVLFNNFTLTHYSDSVDSGIEQLRGDDGELVIYDLMGRKLTDTENLKSGIYIVNGRKIIVK